MQTSEPNQTAFQCTDAERTQAALIVPWFWAMRTRMIPWRRLN